MAERGKAWTEDECYLAVWLYDYFDTSICPGTKTMMYNKISSIIGRSAKSVEFKVQNVAAIDPRDASEKPIAMMNHYQKLLKEVFDRYWNNREAARKQYNDVVSRLTEK